MSLAKLEKIFYKANCQSWLKKNVYPFENDKSDVAVSASEFLIVDLDHDKDENIDIM